MTRRWSDTQKNVNIRTIHGSFCFAIKTRIRREETRGGKIRKVKGKNPCLKRCVQSVVVVFLVVLVFILVIVVIWWLW